MADLVRGFVERSSTVFLRRGGKTSVSSAEDVLGLLAPHVWAPGGTTWGKSPKQCVHTEGFLSSHTPTLFGVSDHFCTSEKLGFHRQKLGFEHVIYDTSR